MMHRCPFLSSEKDMLNVEQRIKFRLRNHISPHFAIMVFNVPKPILVISLKLSVRKLFGAHWYKKAAVKEEEITGDSK